MKKQDMIIIQNFGYHCNLYLHVTIGNGSVRFGSVREGPNRTGLEPNRLKILKLEPNRTEPRNR